MHKKQRYVRPPPQAILDHTPVIRSPKRTLTATGSDRTLTDSRKSVNSLQSAMQEASSSSIPGLNASSAHLASRKPASPFTGQGAQLDTSALSASQSKDFPPGMVSPVISTKPTRAEEERNMQIIMRTPEGKMWKAEEKRDRERDEKEKRTEWAHHTVMKFCGGGKINTTKAKSELDWVIYNAAEGPAPNAYTLQSNPLKTGLTKGGRFGTDSRTTFTNREAEGKPGVGSYEMQQSAPVGGGKFSSSQRVSFMEHVERLARQLPGPGEYQPPSLLLSKGTKFTTSNNPRGPDLALREARCMPGPASYEQLDHAPFQHVKGGEIQGRTANGVYDLEVQRAADIPGPQHYHPKTEFKAAGGMISSSKVRAPPPEPRNPGVV
ncbi:hypothetical protein T484DRAFT_3118776 [Baffinella frigidus]|nr:hypothetical protein T484DRAFT_3118776 [Cryptophyta sp. CCMP2293]